jgi:hypothetical protein
VTQAFSAFIVNVCIDQRFGHFASLYKEPCEGVSRIGAVRLHCEDVGEEALGLIGLVAVGLELGALEEGEKIGTVLLGGCKVANYLRIWAAPRKLSANGSTLFANGESRSVSVSYDLRMGEFCLCNK